MKVKLISNGENWESLDSVSQVGDGLEDDVGVGVDGVGVEDVHGPRFDVWQVEAEKGKEHSYFNIWLRSQGVWFKNVGPGFEYCKGEKIGLAEIICHY